MLLHCAGCGSRSRAELSEMRVEGSRLVVTCRTCGLSVVAVGWNEGPAPQDDVAPEDGASAEPPSGEMVSGRLELEEGDEPAPPPGLSVAPEAPRGLPPQPRETVSPGVGAPARSPMPKVVIASGVIALACVLSVLAWRARRTEKAPEPRAVEPIPTSASAAGTSTRPAAEALRPATPVPAPTTRPHPQSPATARTVPQTPTPKPPATVAGPTTVSEAEALSSRLVDPEAFEDRAGKVMTYLLFCRNSELARHPDAALGAFDVSLVVSPSGAVSEVRLDRAVARSPLGACLRENLAKLEFPSWKGRPVEVRRHVEAVSKETRKAP